jgi:Uma2 family endonuclease
MHQAISLSLGASLKAALKKECDKCKVYLPIDWKINENTVVQPDLLVVCREITNKVLDFAPSVVVEILSPSTAYKDRHEKFELYEQEGVPYYIIVDPQFKKIEIFELLNGKYQLSTIPPNHFAFVPEQGCRFSLSFDSIWA